jgi:DNA modification methylase
MDLSNPVSCDAKTSHQAGESIDPAYLAPGDAAQANQCLADLLQNYRRNPQPIPVNIRNMVHWLDHSERATHNIHSYPAKLLIHIPHLFLANTLLSQPGDSVFDPFCGSGTVLLESQLNGRHSAGADSNPLARLISRVKTTPLGKFELEGALGALVDSFSEYTEAPPPNVININHWFSPRIQSELQKISQAIAGVREDAHSRFFQICLSSTLRRVSLADPRLSVPVRLKLDRYDKNHWLYSKTQKRLSALDTMKARDVFLEVTRQNIKRVHGLSGLIRNEAQAEVVESDSRRLHIDYSDNGRSGQIIPGNSVQLIITSPPYAGAQKYIRASSLSLGWLGLCDAKGLKPLEDQTIGREHFAKATHREFYPTGIVRADELLGEIHKENSLRAHIASTYIAEMAAALAEMHRILKPGGYLVLIAGSNSICGREFPTHDYLHEIALLTGLQTKLILVDAIRSRALMTRRNKTAGLIHREWIILLKKPTSHE